MSLNKLFTRFSNGVAHWIGRPLVFLIACGLVLVWAFSGPLFHFSETWQLIINTSTTIVTFLIVFLIQNTQNRDNAAIQAKLDEIIRASQSRNAFIGLEHESDEVISKILKEVEAHADDCHAVMEAQRAATAAEEEAVEARAKVRKLTNAAKKRALDRKATPKSGTSAPAGPRRSKQSSTSP